MLSTVTIALADAKAIAATAAVKACENAWSVVIAVLDQGGHLLYLECADNVQLGSIVVA